LSEDLRLLCGANQFVSVSESEMILRVNHEDAEKDREQVSGSDSEYRKASAGQCAKDIHNR
jgi:hypothetical protein